MTLTRNEFLATFAYRRIKNFSRLIDTSIKNEKQSKNENFVSLFNKLNDLVDQVDVINKNDRYGNSGFINLIDGFRTNFSVYLVDIYKEKCTEEITDNLYKYFSMSFGNIDRIDFGTGHELNFLCFLYIMVEEKLIKLNEVCFAIDTYSSLIRKIIDKYTLEAAGSHGVWGLDDYQILSFLYGSSQLCNTNLFYYDLLNPDLHSDLLYAKALNFSIKNKSQTTDVDISVHSPVLFELGKKSWNKINEEIFEMFDKFLLKNYGANQHFIFSKYLPRSILPEYNDDDLG